MVKKAVFQLEPFTCPSCVKKIESALQKLEGVDSVSVMFHSGKVRTEFDEVLLNPKQITDTLSNLGFAVLSEKIL